ncbi:GNAT family N-acetyltransferase [Chitiniphilus eburneus]|uniref:GNAT family N-acetyltransferase n=1 Tax=Chitiniphilus eburneus TaxID=2571148 RepID=A0A4U0QBM2_9NEIS|nr:GNAT family N-acetyltransferase [Chitiniphilus eburneus]TJZ78767.1 GNAT family N-acetyltransferase [Chitiniphilus eburneus]
MRVRLATAGDLLAALELFAALNPDDPILDPATAESTWAQLLAHPGVSVWLAEVDGQTVATCTLIIVPNLTRNARPYALIENVVTLAHHRRQGHARAVLEAALSAAWAANCYKGMLSTSAREPGVLDFYRRCGFRDGIKTGFVATAP